MLSSLPDSEKLCRIASLTRTMMPSQFAPINYSKNHRRNIVSQEVSKLKATVGVVEIKI